MVSFQIEYDPAVWEKTRTWKSRLNVIGGKPLGIFHFAEPRINLRTHVRMLRGEVVELFPSDDLHGAPTSCVPRMGIYLLFPIWDYIVI